jgi:hypothetical protein
LRRLVITAPLLVVALSCGARSSLRVASSASGGEGGTSSASSSASSSGAGGASPEVCGSINVEQIMFAVDDADADLTQPSLVELPTSPPTVALVYSRKPLAAGAPSIARVATFAGWGAWPPSPTIVDLTDPAAGNAPVPGVGLLATSRRSPGPPHFALLHSDADGLSSRSSLRAEATGSIGTSGDPRPGKPLLFASDPASDNFFFSGFSAVDGGNFALHLQDGTDEWTNGFPMFGCSSTPLAADVAGLGTGAEKGWIVAAALGTGINIEAPPPTPSSCAATFGTVGPAKALIVIRISPAGLGIASDVIEMDDAIVTQIRMAPRATGAWVTWSREGSPSLLTATVTPTLVVDQLFAIDPWDDGAVATSSFDTKSLKSLNEVAMVVRSPGESDRVQFLQLPGIGYAGGSGLDFSAEGRIDGPVSLLISEATDSALVAWSELPPGASQHRLRVARIECLTSP